MVKYRDKEKKSWEVLIDTLTPAIGCAFQLLVFFLGLFQWVAIQDGLKIWLDFHWLITVPLGFILAYIPIIGTVIGIYGALEAWGWSLTKALILFIGPFVFTILLYFVVIILNYFDSRRRNR